MSSSRRRGSCILVFVFMSLCILFPLIEGVRGSCIFFEIYKKRRNLRFLFHCHQSIISLLSVYNQFLIYHQSLIYIDVSLDSRMIFGDFSDGYGVEFLIVHVFDDKLSVFDSDNNSYMSVVGIVSMSFKLYDSTNSWGFTSRYSLSFGITDPLVCISSPGYTLVLCDESGTVSPRESSIQSRISNLVCFISLFYSGVCIKKAF